MGVEAYLRVKVQMLDDIARVYLVGGKRGSRVRAVQIGVWHAGRKTKMVINVVFKDKGRSSHPEDHSKYRITPAWFELCWVTLG
jgi:hypothetical protein